MKTHLSEEQISRWIAGDRAPEAERHLRVCMQCATEVAHMKKLLADFHDGVIAWSDSQMDAEAPVQWTLLAPARRSKSAALLLRLAAATVVVMLALLLFHDYNRRRAIKVFEADVKLLEEVNTQIAQPVPTSLKPLMQLVSWETIDIEQ